MFNRRRVKVLRGLPETSESKVNFIFAELASRVEIKVEWHFEENYFVVVELSYPVSSPFLEEIELALKEVDMGG